MWGGTAQRQRRDNRQRSPAATPSSTPMGTSQRPAPNSATYALPPHLIGSRSATSAGATSALLPPSASGRSPTTLPSIPKRSRLTRLDCGAPGFAPIVAPVCELPCCCCCCCWRRVRWVGRRPPPAIAPPLPLPCAGPAWAVPSSLASALPPPADAGACVAAAAFSAPRRRRNSTTAGGSRCSASSRASATWSGVMAASNCLFSASMRLCSSRDAGCG